MSGGKRRRQRRRDRKERIERKEKKGKEKKRKEKKRKAKNKQTTNGGRVSSWPTARSRVGGEPGSRRGPAGAS